MIYPGKEAEQYADIKADMLGILTIREVQLKFTSVQPTMVLVLQMNTMYSVMLCERSTVYHGDMDEMAKGDKVFARQHLSCRAEELLGCIARHSLFVFSP